MTQEQATTILFNVMMAAIAEVLHSRGLFDKDDLAALAESIGGSSEDRTMQESAAMLAETIRTGLPPRLAVIDGGKPLSRP